MTSEFENMMQEAAPSLPEAGPIRHTNRALMQERIRRDLPRHRRNYRLGVAAAGLALAILFVGQVDNVGSDGWDVKSGSTPLPNGEQGVSFKRDFGPGTVVGKSVTEHEAREHLMASTAHQGQILKVRGLEIHGVTHWSVYTLIDIDGKPTRSARDPIGMVSAMTKDHDAIAQSGYLLQIMGEARDTSPKFTRIDTIEGTPVKIGIWEFHHPDFGVIKYYEGVPIH